MLSSDATISKELLAEVIAAGHSRMPVYEGTNKQAGLGRATGSALPPPPPLPPLPLLPPPPPPPPALQ